MIIPAWLRYGAPMLLAAVIAAGSTSCYYRGEAAQAALDASEAQKLAVQAAQDEYVRQHTETERRRFLLAAQTKAETDEEDSRDVRVDTRVERVYVRATCPSVPTAAADAGGAGAGAAELDPAYRRTLSQLRRAAREQLRLLNFCRAELRARSQH